jgi:hypothetical protein
LNLNKPIHNLNKLVSTLHEDSCTWVSIWYKMNPCCPGYDCFPYIYAVYSKTSVSATLRSQIISICQIDIGIFTTYSWCTLPMISQIFGNLDVFFLVGPFELKIMMFNSAYATQTPICCHVLTKKKCFEQIWIFMLPWKFCWFFWRKNIRTKLSFITTQLLLYEMTFRLNKLSDS